VAGTRLAGATIVITGAGSGIGRLMALEAAERGSAVVLWDRDQHRLDAVEKELTAVGARVYATAVDVSDREAVYAAAERTTAAVGAPDVVINNAGVVSGRAILELSEDAIERTFAVNVMPLYWTTKAFLPAMVARGSGHVVTIASAAGLVGVARQTDYSASKHAAVGFNEALRSEMRLLSTGIQTTIVCPYYINTGMFDGVETRFPKLLPLLEPADVARKTLDAIEKGRAQLILPPLIRLLPASRILPVRLTDWINDFLGINHGMDHFSGRPGDVVGRQQDDTPARAEIS
jgi:all-trans-retinol dehydrogenase (NAD+)